MEFRLAWATDQLVSFIVPLKDLVTSVLFYMSDFGNFRNAQKFVSKSATQKIMSGFVMAIIPSILRIIQCIRAIYLGIEYFTKLFYVFTFLHVLVFNRLFRNVKK
ncbi:hypothetical protein IMG5_183970, partial [Ichthyophthirius multifiliis]